MQLPGATRTRDLKVPVWSGDCRLGRARIKVGEQSSLGTAKLPMVEALQPLAESKRSEEMRKLLGRTFFPCTNPLCIDPPR